MEVSISGNMGATIQSPVSYVQSAQCEEACTSIANGVGDSGPRDLQVWCVETLGPELR